MRIIATYEDNYLEHYGIKGQKWGLRRYQNPDGTLTALGKKHYGEDFTKVTSVRRLTRNLRNAEASSEKMSGYRFKNQLKLNRLKKSAGDTPTFRQYSKIEKLEKKVDAYNKRIEDVDTYEGMILAKAELQGNVRKVRRQAEKLGLDSNWIQRKTKKLLYEDYAKRQIKEIIGHTNEDQKEKDPKVEQPSKENNHSVDYSSEESVNSHVHNVQSQFNAAANNENVWKKHQLGQDTVGNFVEKKEYKDLVDYVTDATKDIKANAIKAAETATRSKESNKKPGPLWTEMRKENVKYWDKLSDSALDYINKNFKTDEEKEIAKGVIYWWFIDW